MPRFVVLVEGKGLDAPTHKGEPIRGFFVRRLVEAPSVDEARVLALAQIESDWTEGPFAAWKQVPGIEAVDAGPAGLLARLRVSTKYIFHRGK